ncbi:MAG: bifunctional metallophosphatase/5'-nucleotidase [Planctomycetota bacterium]|nr:bifunctional metallophosphatase/5'-nucleotidase [Planctomycetota bacterium]
MRLSIGLLLAAGALVAAPALAQRSVASNTTTRGATLSAKSVKAFPSKDTGVTPVDLWLHVLHNNDGESKVLPLGGAQTGFGGAARFKTLVDNLKSEANTPRGDGVAQGWLMISSGDNILPGVNLNAAINNGVPYYDSILFDLIGYSAMTLGNHDFDANPDILANLIAGTNNTPFISANLSFLNEPVLQAQVNAGKLARSKVVTVQGRQVGIIGATTESLPFISSPRNTTIGPVLAAVQQEITTLTNQGVQILILSTHLQGLSSELALVPQLSGIDAVIAGGGSEILANASDLLVPGDVANFPYPVVVQDQLGRNVPVVTTVGDYKYVGRLVLGFDAAGNLIATDSALSGPKRVSGVAPDGVAPDATVQSLVVNPVQAANDALDSNIIAISDVALESRRNVSGAPAPQANFGIRVSETNVGNLVADSILWEATRVAAVNNLPVPDISIQNGGGIRLNSVRLAGPITERYTYDQLPFTNVLTLVPNIGPVQLKVILENAVSRVAGADGRFPHVSGMRIVWDANGTAQVLTPDVPPFTVSVPGSRVRDVILNDGRSIIRDGQIVPGAPSVNIATIDFLAVQGGDQYPFNNAPFVRLGITYQQAFFNYLTEFLGGVVTGAEYPNAINNRVIRRN